MDSARTAQGAGGTAGAVARRRGRPRWVRYVYGAIIVEVVLLAIVLPRDPTFWLLLDQLAEPLRRAQHARELKALMRKDPATGVQILTPNTAPLRTALGYGESREPVVLVFVGPCTSCASKRMWDWSDAVDLYRRRSVAIVSRDSPERIAAFVRSERFRLPIVADANGKLAELFNAVWIPRTYALSRGGTVTWVQKDDRMSPYSIACSLWGNKRRR